MSELHDKNEPRFRPRQLYSLLDIMGPEIVCDRCGNWQQLKTISLEQARRIAQETGWEEMDGKDICPKCLGDN